MLDVRRSLLDYDPETLRAIAASRGLPLKDNKAELISMLVEESTLPLSLQLLWSDLGPREREALATLAAHGGELAAVYFEAEYGTVRHYGPARLLRERLWENPVNTSERLFFLGLAFRGFSEDGSAATWYIPSDVLPLLPLPDATRHVSLPQPISGEVEVSREANDLLLRATFRALLAARERQHPLAGALQRILAPEPDAPDDERLRTIAALAISLGEAMGFLRDGQIARGRQSQILRWLRLPRARAMAELYHAWLTASAWHELANAPGLIYEGGNLPDPAPARAALVRALGRLQPRRWYAVADLQAYLRSTQPDFLRRDSNYDSLYLRDSSSGAPLDGLEAWMQVEGRFVEEVLVALNALGQVSLGASQGSRCFRLEAHSPGAEAQPSDEPLRCNRFDLTVDLQIVLPRDCSLYLLYQVERIAEAVGGDKQNLRFQLSRRSLRRAADSGVGTERVLAFLRRHAGHFDGTHESAIMALTGPVVLDAEAMVLLTRPTDDEPALPDPTQLGGIGERLSDGRLLIPRRRWPEVEAKLAALGIKVRRRPGS